MGLRFGRAARRLLRIGLGTALALLAFEPIARFYYGYPGVTEPGIGPVVAAGERARFCIEGCASSTWQAHGVRAVHPFDPSRPVILAVGDSYTEALNVDDSEVFTTRLERALGGGVQVLNVGHSGFSAADYLALAGRHEGLFHPRWTIVTLKGDDFEGVERGIYHFAHDGGTLASEGVPPPPMSARLAPVRKHIALYSFAVYRWHQLLAGAAAEPPLFLGGKAALAAQPSPPPVASASEILAALARAYDHRVTFVFLPRPEPDHEPPPAAEEAFAAACTEQGLSCVDPRSRFQALVDAGTPAYGFENSVPNTGHMNARGHAALADALTEELGRLALL